MLFRSNVGWNLYTSATLGTLEGTDGTFEGSFTNTTPQVISGTNLSTMLLGTKDYIGITASPNCDVEIASIQVDYTNGAPEPGTLVLMGCALLGLGVAGKKLRRNRS